MDSLPENLRIKIWRMTGERRECVDSPLGAIFVETLKDLDEKLAEADCIYEEKRREVRGKFGLDADEEYVWTLPEPAILSISRSELEELLKRGGESLLKEPITIEWRGKLYRIVLEFPCG